MNPKPFHELSHRRFVVLEHDHPFLHWDFFIEQDEDLQAWRLLRQPEPDSRIPAEPLPGHRRLYLDYEGPVARNRGSVRRIFSGTLIQLESNADPTYRISGSSLGRLCRLVHDPKTGPFWEFSR